MSVRQISDERLETYSQRLGTGHTVEDARLMIRELRRIYQFMRDESERLLDEGNEAASVRLWEASRVPWETGRLAGTPEPHKNDVDS